MTQQRLALGTVQFGLAYGLAGRGEAVPASEVRTILRRARTLGITTLDTAAAYGDIEERLGELGGGEFEIVSKIERLPDDVALEAVDDWVRTQAERSLSRLGDSLVALMAHRDEDLTDSRGAAMWSALRRWGADRGVAVGASCYDPSRLALLSGLDGFRVAQVPGNAFDQRVACLRADTSTIKVHLRSAFLQGLLLMSPQVAERALPQAAAALAAWRAWCTSRCTSPMVAALSVVKSFAVVNTCVVGVDSLVQLEEIAAAWSEAVPVAAPELACADPAVVDPRAWRTS